MNLRRWAPLLWISAFAVASVAAAQDRTLPGTSTQRLEDGLRDALRGVDPRSDGWDSEAFSDAVAERLGEVRAWFEGGGDAPAWSWVAPDAPFDELARTRAADALPAGDGAVFRPADVPAVGGRGPAGLAAWLAPWRDLTERRLKLKVVAVDWSEVTVRTDVRVELAGARAGGRVAAVGWFALDWAREPLQLVGGPGARLEAWSTPRRTFEDRSRAAFGARWERQLAPGLTWWQRRIPSNLGVSFLGHQGFALGDVDGDRLEDLYVCQPGGLPNLLYLRTPDGGAREVGASFGVDWLDPSRAALLVDLDADGDRDLCVTIGEELVVCENLEGAFEERWSGTVGVSTSLAAADVDGDGDLDVFVCGYVDPYSDETAPRPYEDARNGAPNTLFENRCERDESGALRWSFVDATDARGLSENNDRFTFAASFEDYDDDGDPDLYVANDFGRNGFYRNDGGRFRDVAAELGVEDQAAGMGVTWGDANGDGRLDLYVSNMDSSAGRRLVDQRLFRERQGEVDPFARHAAGNSLFLRAEDGFADASVELGVRRGRWAWGASFCELDNDGRPDLVVPNGFVTGARYDDL